MKLFLALFLTFFISTIYIYASDSSFVFEQKLTVGLQPVTVFLGNNYSDGLNIICSGIDANFNGVMDEDDQPPSWWKATILVGPKNTVWIGKPFKVLDFQFGNIGFPFRPAISRTNETLYISINGNIWAYNYKSGDLIDSSVTQISASGLAIDDSLLFISVRPDFTNPGYVFIFDINKKIVLDTVPAYKNVQQLLILDNNKIAILNEGTSGVNDSKVQIVDYSEYKHKILFNLDAGIGANHLSKSEKYLLVTSNGSHEILIYDLKDFYLIKTIKLPTVGFNGPRESFISEKLGKIFTTAYDGNLYVHSLDGLFIDSLKSFAKPEGFLVDDKIPMIITANEYLEGTYSPDSTISLFIYKKITQVDDDISKNNVQIFQKNDNLEIILPENINTQQVFDIKIYSITGDLLYQKDYNFISSNQIFSIVKPVNNTGVYLIKIQIGKTIYYSKFYIY